jgi:copper chaperone CopZ
MLKDLFDRNTIEFTLKIEGMHCEGCSNTLSGVLQRMKGIKKNEVSLSLNQAKVRFNPEKISIQEIIYDIQLKTSFKVSEKIMQ